MDSGGEFPSRQHPEHPLLLGARHRVALGIALGRRPERLVTERRRHRVRGDPAVDRERAVQPPHSRPPPPPPAASPASAPRTAPPSTPARPPCGVDTAAGGQAPATFSAP